MLRSKAAVEEKVVIIVDHYRSPFFILSLSLTSIAKEIVIIVKFVVIEPAFIVDMLEEKDIHLYL